MQAILLVVNAGSTSIKTCLFDTDLQGRAELAADCGALPQMFVKGRNWHGETIQETLVCADFEASLRAVFEHWHTLLTDLPVTLSAIGHRIVHGGDSFSDLTLLDATVLQQLAQYDDLAPLHNPNNRLGATIAAQIFAGVAQYGVFDTAFHRTLPEYAQRYAIQTELAERFNLHRFGFHGIACRQALRKAAQFLGRDESSLNMIVLHLGGGASATAIRNGISVDTSMGFSPLEGLMMASRCGDIDPIIPLRLLQQGMSSEQIDHLLHHNSGLIGICGSSDMRAALEHAQNGDAAAQLAVDMYCYRVKKYIGAYAAVLGKIDAIVFSGGIGEHAAEIRARILAGLEFFNIKLDNDANRQKLVDIANLSAPDSTVRVLALRVNEEEEIARQMLNLPKATDPS